MLIEREDDPIPADVDPVEWIRQRQAETADAIEQNRQHMQQVMDDADAETARRHAEDAELEQQMWNIVHRQRADNDARGA